MSAEGLWTLSVNSAHIVRIMESRWPKQKEWNALPPMRSPSLDAAVLALQDVFRHDAKRTEIRESVLREVSRVHELLHIHSWTPPENYRQEIFSLCALIAWDSAGDLMEMELPLLRFLVEVGDPRAVLMYPALSVVRGFHANV